MSKTLNNLLIIFCTTIILTCLIWLPHLLALPNFWGLKFNEGFSTILRNFDGIEYIIISKTMYSPSLIAGIPQPQPALYFASHFPGYALLIGLFAPILGYLKSMLFVSILSTVLSAWVFYFLVRDFKLSDHPLFLSLLFLILPARWLIVHSVGSSEPLFIFFVLTCVYFFMKFTINYKPYTIFLASIFGLAASITRPPGILIFIGMALFVLWQRRNIFKYFPLILMPVGLLAIFYLYSVQYGDFFAYFHSGDNIHLTLPPFQVFNEGQFWVGDIWLEDLIYIFSLGFLGGVILWKKKLFPLAFIVFTYLGASTLIAHRDISRYILPVTPFILIAFEKVLTSREFKIILPIVALAIYLYSQNFIIANVAPVADLEVFN